MAELLYKANQILTEKQNKLKPEYIKEGVTIFDVEGNYEKPTVEYIDHLSNVNMENLTSTYVFEDDGNGGYIDTMYGHQVKDVIVGKLHFNVLRDEDVVFYISNTGNFSAGGDFKWLLIGNIDTELSLENADDDSSLIYKSYKHISLFGKKVITFNNVTAGEHFVYFKIVTSNKWHSSEQYRIEPRVRSTIYNYVKFYNDLIELTNDTTQAVNTLATCKNTEFIEDGCGIVYRFNGTEWEELAELDGLGFAGEQVQYINYNQDMNRLIVDYGETFGPATFKSNSYIGFEVTGDMLANAIGLTPESIVSGNTILGIEGTGGGGSSGDFNEYGNMFVQMTEPKTGELGNTYRLVSLPLSQFNYTMYDNSEIMSPTIYISDNTETTGFVDLEMTVTGIFDFSNNMIIKLRAILQDVWGEEILSEGISIEPYKDILVSDRYVRISIQNIATTLDEAKSLIGKVSSVTYELTYVEA